MRTTLILLVAGLAMAACGGDETPPPTCSEAMASYYGEGCTDFDGLTARTQDEATAECESDTTVSAKCQSIADDLRRCYGEGLGRAEDCDCGNYTVPLAECEAGARQR